MSTVTLLTIDPRSGTAKPLRLWEQKRGASTSLAELYLWHDRLYVIGRRLDVLDVGRPEAPRVLSDGPFDRPMPHSSPAELSDRVPVQLLPLPGLPPEQRLAATLGYTPAYNRPAFDGRVVCQSDPSLSGYRLTRLDLDAATFEPIGRFQPTPLQRLFGYPGSYAGGDLTLSDGLVYVDGLGNGGPLDSSVTLIDTRGPRPMRNVGHFAAPGAEFVRPLPDGRAVVGGGQHLWLVGPPPTRSGG